MAQKMDKNSLIGFLLIGVILVGWTWWNTPSAEERIAAQRAHDSIAQIEKEQAEAQARMDSIAMAERNDAPVMAMSDSAQGVADSLKNAEQLQKFGRFSNASTGAVDYYTLENEKVEMKISNLGGRPVSIRLKEYMKYDSSSSIYLLDQDSSRFYLQFKSQNRVLKTEDFFFKGEVADVKVDGDQTGKLSLKLYSNNPSQYIEYVYTLEGNSYDAGFQVNFVGLDDLVMDNQDRVALYWQIKTPAHEKGFSNENNRTSLFYKPVDDGKDYINERSPGREDLEDNLDWIAYKQQFFSLALIGNQPFLGNGNYLETKEATAESGYIKDMIVSVDMPIDRSNNSAGYKMYLGPNQYYELRQRDLDGILDLGWGLFRWVSQWFIIPIFTMLTKLDISYGIIILLLTLMIKLILSPLTYKSYLSGAKMRVLKPEIEEINQKFKDADPMKKQQEVMGLYRKAGVNPMAGCFPMLLQMPILYALFMLFPSSIELRGEPFLWATDLSTYDAIFTWDAEIPLVSRFYGNHVSLFTVLMAFSLFFYTRSNMSSGLWVQVVKCRLSR
ncbi:membrane protein insertase YidC [bacterium SCSIO 12741]|nr:membrane protein insertase YidC [bacterium SCSIO 12741]